MTDIGDLVLVHFKDEPAFFARIEGITSDKKPDWYQVSLLVLQVPLMEITWILKSEYINGDTFTMNGDDVRMEKVKPPENGLEKVTQDTKSPKNDKDTDKGAKVVSLFDRKS